MSLTLHGLLTITLIFSSLHKSISQDSGWVTPNIDISLEKRGYD